MYVIIDYANTLNMFDVFNGSPEECKKFTESKYSVKNFDVCDDFFNGVLRNTSDDFSFFCDTLDNFIDCIKFSVNVQK